MSPRLPLRELAEASADPYAYRTKFFGPARRAQGSPYFLSLRNALFNLHKLGWNTAEARGYLEKALEKHPNALKKAETMDQFTWYVRELEGAGRRVFRTRLNVDIPLPSWTPDDFSCSGEVSRLDLAQSGCYAAWRFDSGDARGWQEDLRMPMIQEAVARILDAPTDEITVGVYAFRARSIQYRRYSASEITAARSMLEDTVRRLLAQQP